MAVRPKSQDSDPIVLMTKKEFDDLIYFTTYRAMDMIEKSSFKGYLPFYTLINDQLEQLIKDVEYLKIAMQSSCKGDE